MGGGVNFGCEGWGVGRTMCRAGSSVHHGRKAAVGPETVWEVLRTWLPSGLKPLLIITQLGQVDYWRGACPRAEQGHQSGDPEQGQEGEHFSNGRMLGPSRKEGGGWWLLVRLAICPYDDGSTSTDTDSSTCKRIRRFLRDQKARLRDFQWLRGLVHYI